VLHDNPASCTVGNKRRRALLAIQLAGRSFAIVAETGRAHLRQRKLVYVVDDDPSMLRGVQRLLKEHGYDTVSFTSANSFHDHNDFRRVVCVVLDIDLDGESGIEVHRQLKSAGIQLPVIYMTAKDCPAVRKAAVASGCLAYLTKPFTARSLIEPIERASITGA